MNNFNTFLKIRDSLKNKLIISLEKNYGCALEDLKSYNFYKLGNGKIYVSTIDITIPIIKNLEIRKIVSTGIYFGTILNNKLRFRLSIEGSRLIKPKINFIELDKENLSKYLSAENLFENEIKNISVNKENFSEFLIVKFENVNIGVVSFKEGIFLNYIPKSRKINFNKLF
jgi:NOL1/NOP2/fmu family ribosome biogenesis protein